MKLANAPAKYDQGDQARMRGALEQADAENVKRGISQTYYLLSKADGTVGKLTVDNTGALVWTAL